LIQCVAAGKVRQVHLFKNKKDINFSMLNKLSGYTGGTAVSSTNGTNWTNGLLGPGHAFLFQLGCN
jgi:hypothetical protein